MNEAEQVAFELGFDLASYGRDLPADASLALCDGWRWGKKSHPHTRHADRFKAKWLQLRLGALRRQKRFSPEITADYLRRIELLNCPVTGVPLTHSTRSDTDWSVDRCNNDLGYVVGNIIIVSTRVNNIKGDLTLAEIRNRATRPEGCDGLSHEEWNRLLAIVDHATKVSRGEPPPQYFTGETWVLGLPYGPAALIQAFLLVMVSMLARGRNSDHSDDRLTEAAETFLNELELLSKHSKPARRAFRNLITDMFRRATGTGETHWSYWGLKRPSRLFVEWWVSVPMEARQDLEDRVSKMGFTPEDKRVPE